MSDEPDARIERRLTLIIYLLEMLRKDMEHEMIDEALAAMKELQNASKTR